MRSKAGNSNRVVRIVTLPYRALLKARDYYVKSITDCGNPSVYSRAGMIGGPGASQAGGLPRSFSVQSYSSADSDDLRELIRANSTNNLEITKADLELFIQQHLRQQKQASKGVPRSVSVGMARIDEEAPSGLGEIYDEDVKMMKTEKLMYPRSKSYAVNKKFDV